MKQGEVVIDESEESPVESAGMSIPADHAYRLIDCHIQTAPWR